MPWLGLDWLLQLGIKRLELGFGLVFYRWCSNWCILYFVCRRLMDMCLQLIMQFVLDVIFPFMFGFRFGDVTFLFTLPYFFGKVNWVKIWLFQIKCLVNAYCFLENAHSLWYCCVTAIDACIPMIPFLLQATTSIFSKFPITPLKPNSKHENVTLEEPIGFIFHKILLFDTTLCEGRRVG